MTELKQGVKHDEGKNRMDLMSPWFIIEMSKVLTYGATKYEEHNWVKGLKYSRCFGAALRHMYAWWSGETNDPETDLHHLAHAACCLMFLLHYETNTLVSYSDYNDKPPFDTSVD